MKIALSTVCLPEFTWQDCFGEAAKAGYQYLELLMIPRWVHIHPGEVPPAEVRRVADRAGLKIIGLHAAELNGLNAQTIQDTKAYVCSVLHFARELGVPLVNVNGGYVPDQFNPADRSAVLSRIAAALRELAPVLEEFDLRLTLENHFHFQLETPADYQAVLSRAGDLPRVGITVDTGHFTSVGVDIPAFIQAWGPRIFHAHIKDHITAHSVALGQGQTDNRAVLAALQAQGFSGYLSVELEVRDRPNAVRYVHEARPYLEKLIRETAP